jgi:site-specific DNA recombinase
MSPMSRVFTQKRLSLSAQVTERSKKRTALYGRFSSDLQRPSSIVDQRRRCQAYADAHDLEVVAHYADEAEKGWNRERKQYQAMLAAAKRGEFEVLLVDELSRLFRDAGEQHNTLQRLRILGVQVIAVAEGWDSYAKGAKLTAGIKGLMNEQALEVIATETHRGLEGRVMEGMSAGGDVYGYITEPVFQGSREIGRRRVVVEAEADVVRSIYADYAAGFSPARIADRLNAQGISGPRGGLWGRNAIYGDRRDLSGILNNPIYRGELVWNRSKFLRDPDTGARIKQRNPEEEWVRVQAPELCIISDDLYNEVQARMQETAHKGEAVRKGMGEKARSGADGKFMLTGLLQCAVCGGPISSAGPNLFGCSVRHNRGVHACVNDVKFRRDAAEQQVIEAVRGQLFTAEAIDKYVAYLTDELSRQDASSETANTAWRKALMEAEKGIANCLRFVEQGHANASIAARLTELEGKASEARDELIKLESAPGLSPNDIEVLKAAGLEALRNLPELLAGAAPEARTILGRLLGKSVVEPTADKTSLEIKMAGQMTGLLAIPAVKQRKTARLGNVVAGAGFEPTTFGL